MSTTASHLWIRAPLLLAHGGSLGSKAELQPPGPRSAALTPRRGAAPKTPASPRSAQQAQGFAGYERVKELELWRVTAPGQGESGIDAP